MEPIIPDFIKSTSDAIQANLPETAKQSDGALSTVVGFFNNVVLYPVKKANITFKYKLELFEEDLKKKIQDIPDENLQAPPLLIAGPTLEALKYTYDEAELRDMYENLLASAMDTRRVNKTHPAYVDTIKQMSPLDAQVLKKIVETHNRLRCVTIQFLIADTGIIYAEGMPLYYVSELSDISDPFAISASLTNLKRLALIDIQMGTLLGVNYEELQRDEYVASRTRMYAEHCKTELGKEMKVEIAEKYFVNVNDYGKNFSDVCM